jgi:hypothetical protein
MRWSTRGDGPFDSESVATGNPRCMPSDEQDQSEQLDNEKLPAVYPPDQPMGVDTYGTAAAEERVGEPITEAIAR